MRCLSKTDCKQKIAFGICVVLLHLSAAAAAQVQPSIYLGGNLSGIFWKEAPGAENIKVKMNPGYYIGSGIYIPVTIHRQDLLLQTGLFVTQKGFKEQYTDELYGPGTLIVSPDYLELPVTLLKREPLGAGSLIFGAGPYLACGLGGNWTIEYDGGRDAGSIEFVDIDNQNEEDANFNYGRRLDYGVSATIGYEFSGWLGIHLGGQLGLRNIAPTKGGNETLETFRNAGLRLALVYTFN